MTATDTFVPSRAAQPVDAVAARLNDPVVAASLVALLDNAELLSTLVVGLSGLISRGEAIVDTLSEGVRDLRIVGSAQSANGPSLADLKTVTNELVEAAPALRLVLNSSMTSPATIELLSMLSDAATEGAAAARQNHTEVKGAVGAYKALREPEVQRGLGVMIEIARALGRRIDTTT